MIDYQKSSLGKRINRNISYFNEKPLKITSQINTFVSNINRGVHISEGVVTTLNLFCVYMSKSNKIE